MLLQTGKTVPHCCSLLKYTVCISAEGDVDNNITVWAKLSLWGIPANLVAPQSQNLREKTLTNHESVHLIRWALIFICWLENNNIKANKRKFARSLLNSLWIFNSVTQQNRQSFSVTQTVSWLCLSLEVVLYAWVPRNMLNYMLQATPHCKV